MTRLANALKRFTEKRIGSGCFTRLSFCIDRSSFGFQGEFWVQTWSFSSNRTNDFNQEGGKTELEEVNISWNRSWASSFGCRSRLNAAHCPTLRPTELGLSWTGFKGKFEGKVLAERKGVLLGSLAVTGPSKCRSFFCAAA